jgi:hypothetical protein
MRETKWIYNANKNDCRFENSLAVKMSVVVFWVVTQSLVGCYISFGGKYLILHKVEMAHSYKTLVSTYKTTQHYDQVDNNRQELSVF